MVVALAGLALRSEFEPVICLEAPQSVPVPARFLLTTGSPRHCISDRLYLNVCTGLCIPGAKTLPTRRQGHGVPGQAGRRATSIQPARS